MIEAYPGELISCRWPRRIFAPHINGATLICLCSPQNPTGTTISEKDLGEICRDGAGGEWPPRAAGEKKLYLMYDQMYWHLTYGEIKRHYNPGVALSGDAGIHDIHRCDQQSVRGDRRAGRLVYFGPVGKLWTK